MRRNRYTPEQKQQHVTQWRHSRLTRKQYCEQHQLNFSSFRDWIADSKKISHDFSLGLSALLPVSLPSAQTPTVTLKTPDGYAIICPLALLPGVIQVLTRC
ncbi:IS66 family insertion sequence element accessory protein TnpA [Xenorhabdus taiwanensis]|uniref:Transposase n=1 Tax=Xenorhabdus taiwanensis TaxID=3085177 RepID=A0ABN7C0C5_9GAMM|nr:hypothetical protein TCT1_08470 [Xenorhabdus sp. TCT-1]